MNLILKYTENTKNILKSSKKNMKTSFNAPKSCFKRFFCTLVTSKAFDLKIHSKHSNIMKSTFNAPKSCFKWLIGPSFHKESMNLINHLKEDFEALKWFSSFFRCYSVFGVLSGFWDQIHDKLVKSGSNHNATVFLVFWVDLRSNSCSKHQKHSNIIKNHENYIQCSQILL